MLVGWKIQSSRIATFVGKSVGREHVVQAEVASVVCHIVAASVREMRQHVGLIQASHRDF
jgi:hypothetical protein